MDTATVSPREIVTRLGGPTAVARMLEITPGAVSQWINPLPGKVPKIPKAQLRYLRVIRPDVFATADAPS